MKEVKGYQAAAMSNAQTAFEKWVELKAALAAWGDANEAWGDACAAWVTAHDSIGSSSQHQYIHDAGYKAGFDAGYDTARILYEGKDSDE